MSSEVLNQPDSLPESTRSKFMAVDTITANEKSLGDIVSCILQHEETGIPLVVRGLNVDPNWLPLPGSNPPAERIDGEYQPSGKWTDLSSSANLIETRYHAVDHPGQQDAPPSKDAIVWVDQLSLISKELLPPGSGETPSMTVEHWESFQSDTANRNEGVDVIFRLR